MKILKDPNQVLRIMRAKLDELHKRFVEAGVEESTEISGQESAIISVAGHIRHAIEDHGYFGADDCHLYLWVTNNFLPDGLKVMEAWGFRYVTMITWLKDRAGLGQYFRGITESCLFGIKGHPSYKIGADGKRCQGLTGFTAPRTIHSRKPEEMRRMIESVSYGPYCELFAREPHPRWDVWGNEVEGIALGSLTKISL